MLTQALEVKQRKMSKNDKEKVRIANKWTTVHEGIASREEARDVVTRQHLMENTRKQQTLNNEVKSQEKQQGGNI